MPINRARAVGKIAARPQARQHVFNVYRREEYGNQVLSHVQRSRPGMQWSLSPTDHPPPSLPLAKDGRDL